VERRSAKARVTRRRTTASATSSRFRITGGVYVGNKLALANRLAICYNPQFFGLAGRLILCLSV